MTEITLHQLRVLCPKSAVAALQVIVEPLNACFEEFGIEATAERQRFVSQYAHETLGFTRLVENLNYTPQGLLTTFPKYFNEESAYALGRTSEHSADQMMIANIAYANRMGNGEPATGDGWRFRGKGLCHMTGRTNHQLAGDGLALDLIAHPEIAIEPGPACRVGGWFWISNRLGEIEDFRTLTRRINGGYNGLDDRFAYLERAKLALA